MSTGLEIAIKQVADTEATIEYDFWVNAGAGGFVVPDATGRPGKVIVSRTDGSTTLVKACPDDTDGVLFSRVVAVLSRHFKNGELPSETWWAG